jgi:hypothetical protein
MTVTRNIKMQIAFAFVSEILCKKTVCVDQIESDVGIKAKDFNSIALKHRAVSKW